MNIKFKYALIGIGSLMLIKYVVFGLNHWDAIFHPLRTEDPNSLFLKPFLGVLQ